MKTTQKIISTEPACIDDSESAPWTDLEIEDFHVKVFKDAYPVTTGHRLYVPMYNNVDVLRDAVMDAVLRGIKGVQDDEWGGHHGQHHASQNGVEPVCGNQLVLISKR